MVPLAWPLASEAPTQRAGAPGRPLSWRTTSSGPPRLHALCGEPPDTGLLHPGATWCVEGWLCA